MKFITFDITNTLIKVSPSVGYHYRNLAKKFDYEFDEEVLNKNFGRFFKHQNKLHPGYGYKSGMNSQDWWHGIIRNLVHENSKSKMLQPPTELEISKISEHIYLEFSKEIYWKKYENCDSILDSLKQKGFGLGVISNFDERLFEIVKNLGIKNYFDWILIPSNSGGHSKPDRDIFLKAFELSKMKDPNELLHVGDDLELDIKASESCGFNSILVKHSSIINEHETSLNQAYNLNDLLDKILKKN